MAIVHINSQREALIASIESDVDQFIEYWKFSHTQSPAEFPLELDEDDWMEQFWYWMEGRI